MRKCRYDLHPRCRRLSLFRSCQSIRTTALARRWPGAALFDLDGNTSCFVSRRNSPRSKLAEGCLTHLNAKRFWSLLRVTCDAAGGHRGRPLSRQLKSSLRRYFPSSAQQDDREGPSSGAAALSSGTAHVRTDAVISSVVHESGAINGATLLPPRRRDTSSHPITATARFSHASPSNADWCCDPFALAIGS